MRIKFSPSIRRHTAAWEIVNDLLMDIRVFKRTRIRVAGLIGTQPSVTPAGMFEVSTNWRRPIVVVCIGRKRYIRDGHHRVMRAINRGQKTMTAYVRRTV